MSSSVKYPIQQSGSSMNLQLCEIPSNAARAAALSADQAPTAIIGCPYMTEPSYFMTTSVTCLHMGIQKFVGFLICGATPKNLTLSSLK
jgi:hypothetical protein